VQAIILQEMTMGSFDMLFTFLLAIFPVMFAITAIQDWRRTHRGRYLALVAVYVVFGLGAVVNFANPNGSLISAFTGVLVVLIAGIVQRSFKKGDPAKGAGKVSKK
jgi:hypothetical protein